MPRPLLTATAAAIVRDVIDARVAGYERQRKKAPTGEEKVLSQIAISELLDLRNQLLGTPPEPEGKAP
jgi:hypothetical protein